jgi:hypothetical protein
MLHVTNDARLNLQCKFADLVSRIAKHLFSTDSIIKSRDSSVGIELVYGLDDRGSRVRFMLLLNECLLLLFISLSTQSGNFWIHPPISVCPTSSYTHCFAHAGDTNWLNA